MVRPTGSPPLWRLFILIYRQTCLTPPHIRPNPPLPKYLTQSINLPKALLFSLSQSQMLKLTQSLIQQLAPIFFQKAHIRAMYCKIVKLYKHPGPCFTWYDAVAIGCFIIAGLIILKVSL